MNCNEYSEMLPEYLSRALPNESMTSLERHAGECDACRAQLEFWQGMAALPQEQPSPMMRTRFNQMLSAFEQGRWEQPSRPQKRSPFAGFFGSLRMPPSPVFATALSLVLAVGFFAGRYTGHQDKSNDQIAALHN